MRFSIKQDQLIKPLQIVGSVIDRRPANPILANFLFRLTPQTLSITGTDQELEMIMHINIDNAEPGELTLPARKLIDICRALPSGSRIDITQEADRATIRSGRSRFTLATLPPTEFPELKEPAVVTQFSIPQKELKKLVDSTAFSMAHQDVRYFLNGICLEIGEGHVRSVATDGHRLAYCSLLHNEGIEGPELHRVIIPRKGVLELSRLIEDVQEPVIVQIADNHVRFLLADTGTIFSSKLVEGQYPDYQQVIPGSNRNELVVEREPFLEALKRTSILSNEKFRSVRLGLRPDGMLRIVAHNLEQEEAEEELDARYLGEEQEIAFNVYYLIEVLQVLEEDDVHILFGDSNSSCLVVRKTEGMECQYVIMPMRI